MVEIATPARSTTAARLAWVSCIVVVTATIWAETEFIGTNSLPLVSHLFVGGAGFIALAYYVRRRWNGWALMALTIVTLALCTVFLPRGFIHGLVRWIGSTNVGIAREFAFATSACSLTPVSIFVHRSARRPRPLLMWQMPVGLVLFTLGELLGFALVFAYIIFTTPSMG